MGCIYARGIHFLLTFEGVVLWFCICRTFDRSSFCYILPNRSSCNTRDSQCCILSPLLTSCFVSYVSYIHVTAVHCFILSSTNPKAPVPYRPDWRLPRSRRRPRSPMPREQAAGVSLIFSRCGINDREYMYILLVVAFLDRSYTVVHRQIQDSQKMAFGKSIPLSLLISSLRPSPFN